MPEPGRYFDIGMILDTWHGITAAGGPDNVTLFSTDRPQHHWVLRGISSMLHILLLLKIILVF